MFSPGKSRALEPIVTFLKKHKSLVVGVLVTASNLPEGAVIVTVKEASNVPPLDMLNVSLPVVLSDEWGVIPLKAGVKVTVAPSEIEFARLVCISFGLSSSGSIDVINVNSAVVASEPVVIKSPTKAP